MNAIFPNRIQHVQQKLKEHHLDACLIEDSVDLFYLTGLKMSAGKLLIYAQGALLLVDGRYFQVAKEKSGLPVEKDTMESLRTFCKKNGVKRCGFDGRHTSYDCFSSLKEALDLQLISSTPLFKTLRSIKEEKEIQAMKKSARLLWQGFKFLSTQLKTGVTEKELCKRFEIFCLEKGAEGMAFEPIVAFGKNSAMPHYHSQNTRLKAGDIVLIDIGCVLGGYNSDMTRVLFYKTPDPLLSKLYTIAKRAQRNALNLCRPGVTLRDLDKAARQVMAEENVEDLFVHGLGHGIGLECHEFPRVASIGEDKDRELEPGMVITIEPGLYIPGKGGVRYEDTIVITENGYVNFYPKS